MNKETKDYLQKADLKDKRFLERSAKKIGKKHDVKSDDILELAVVFKKLLTKRNDREL